MEEYPDLGFGDDYKSRSSYVKPLPVNPQRHLVLEDGDQRLFTATPAILHFGGCVPGREREQIVKVINVSSKSQRLLICSPENSSIAVEYDKCGLLAPGMSQIIRVKFNPADYNYVFDTLRVKGDAYNLYIPIHGYPVVNEVEFPKSMEFGKVPLCETVTKTIRLSCSVPINFSYHIEVSKPHPYIQISPLSGIIQAQTPQIISVTFNPISLATCETRITLHVDQWEFQPIACKITGTAVSGLLESRALPIAEDSIAQHLTATGSMLNDTLGKKSSFAGTLAVKSDRELAFPSQYPPLYPAPTKMLAASPTRAHRDDPVAVVLSSTLQASGVNSALDSATTGPKLLQSSSAKSSMDKPLRPRGPGSGNAFDAGGQWVETHHRKIMEKKLKKTNATGKDTLKQSVTPSGEDVVVDGLRIPYYLDSTTNVNFVLTQERGKLKPKDLKAAIEKNRAEKEMRAAEQKRIREGAAGGGVGVLDLRGLLSEERLNMEEGGPFKRQLRELAFLAEVDDVNKLEIEKGFRISEEFLGAELLTQDDIETVREQRRVTELHNKRTRWQSIICRQKSALVAPADLAIKAGAGAAQAREISQIVTPTYDANSNDVWSKRMNTLRRLISLVSKWIRRYRISQRMKNVKEMLTAAGVTTNAQGREFIAMENATYRSRTISKQKPGTSAATAKGLSGEDVAKAGPFSVASFVCSFPNPAQVRKDLTDQILETNKFTVSPKMVRRSLFPRFIADEGSTFSPIPSAGIERPTSFDDRPLFSLQITPEFSRIGYTVHPSGTVPLSLFSSEVRRPRVGAVDECALRPPADQFLKREELKAATSKDVPDLLSLLKLEPNASDGGAVIEEWNIDMPSVFYENPSYFAEEIDYFRPCQELRIYDPPQTLKETDPDWHMRPLANGWMEVLPDDSLRTKWLSIPGFASVNHYLLGNHDPRSRDPPPLPGPTLSDYFLPDTDRHRSGLHCYNNDHLRTTIQRDPDMAPLQRKLDPGDVLTDSESDDEEKYQVPPPTMQSVREMLRAAIVAPVVETAPVKGGKEAKGKEKDAKGAKGKPSAGKTDNKHEKHAEAAPPVEEAFPLGESDEIKEDQVELLRDRKTLELEAALRKQRRDVASNLAHRLLDISKQSRCIAQAIPVQLPFHEYDQEVYQAIEKSVYTPSQVFVELPPGSPLRSLANR